MTSSQLQSTIEHDFAASFWLKKALCSLKARDPVDAVNDVEVLFNFCRLRLEEARKAGYKRKTTTQRASPPTLRITGRRRLLPR